MAKEYNFDFEFVTYQWPWFVVVFNLSFFFFSFLFFSFFFFFFFFFLTLIFSRWLHEQTEKQRRIWGYKILFLDVLFPLNVEKVIYVDADQVGFIFYEII